MDSLVIDIFNKNYTINHNGKIRVNGKNNSYVDTLTCVSQVANICNTCNRNVDINEIKKYIEELVNKAIEYGIKCFFAMLYRRQSSSSMGL